MKKLIFFILFITTTQLVNAQAISWRAKLGNKKTWEFAGEDPEKNSVQLSYSQLKSKNNFMLGYVAPADEKEWKRILQVNDAAGSAIIEIPELTKTQKDNGTIWFTIPAKQLKKILTQHKKITILVSSLPSDPEKAALVRVRPVHVCTITLIE